MVIGKENFWEGFSAKGQEPIRLNIRLAFDSIYN
jgi:hypothetical protein